MRPITEPVIYDRQMRMQCLTDFCSFLRYKGYCPVNLFPRPDNS